ncbi:MAG: hypothetical protein J2P52_09295 [Blastocatellia bacterium]|nr:hypothetical protein [Blastocatellia bacterium]
MSKTLAIILSVIGGLFLLGILVVGGFVYWFYQNKGKLIQAAQNIEKEAREFGAKTNSEGCLNEALSRHKRDKSFTGRISTQGFLTVCLQASEASPGFCEDVPPQKEIMKSANWMLKKCAGAGMQNDQGCQQIFGVVQTYCHKSIRLLGK